MTTQEVWTRDMRNVSEAIPAGWLVEYDGELYFLPEWQEEPLVRLHNSLLLVGRAHGWL